MESLNLQISGMSCGHCVAAVDKALKGVKGVSGTKVEIGRATVTLDPQVATVDKVLDAVDEAGYAANVA